MDNNQETYFNIFRQLLFSNEYKDLKQDLEFFDRNKIVFYYDESNNYRKVTLRKQKYNNDVFNDFILGGIMNLNGTEYNFLELKTKLRLQHNSNEIKFKHICKNKDFLESLTEKKLIIFLEWLNTSQLYVHYTNINHFYYIIVDIIDEMKFLVYDIQMINILKSTLHRIAKMNHGAFYKILWDFDYPNINDRKLFYLRLHEFIVKYSTSDSIFEQELKRMFYRTSKIMEINLLHGNKEKTVIENYAIFYTRPMYLFYKAKHVFDNEDSLKEIFLKDEQICMLINNETVKFVNSRDYELIQVSDLFVGFVRNYYNFINHLRFDEIDNLIDNLKSEQMYTLKLFAKLIKKSEDISKLLFLSSESEETRRINSKILDVIVR